MESTPGQRLHLHADAAAGLDAAPAHAGSFGIEAQAVLAAQAPAKAAHARARSRSTRPPSAGAQRRILLVEDSEPAIIQICDILAGQGYEVSVARNGREALAQIGQTLPDAMILDLMMPEVDGFEVLQGGARSAGHGPSAGADPDGPARDARRS